MTEKEIQLTINGTKKSIRVRANDLLINILREGMHLTGTKYGCGIGECGACTVMLDGKAVLSCLTLAIDVDGKTITTIEGLSDEGRLDPLQEAFIEQGAIQCGFCTPGMIITAKSLQAKNPNPSEDEIREYLRGNLCRCTGYTSIVKAVESCNMKTI